MMPLKICNLGFSEKVRFFLKKKNMNGNVQKTVKKYLAQVIWKKDKSEDKYLAIASMNGSIIQAQRFNVIAFIKKKESIINKNSYHHMLGKHY